MKKSRYTSEQIVYVLKQVENGSETVAATCRKMGVIDVRELRQLREENAKLKRLVADLSLDKHILQEVLSKKL